MRRNLGVRRATVAFGARGRNGCVGFEGFGVCVGTPASDVVVVLDYERFNGSALLSVQSPICGTAQILLPYVR